MTSSELKNQGNEEFRNGNFEKAVEYYTQAIALNSSISAIYSNRAMCYKRLKQFELCKTDAISSIELEEINIKGHMLLGVSLCELSRDDETSDRIQRGIQSLSKALGLCTSQNVRQYESTLITYILRAKKLLFYKEREIRIKKEENMLSQLRNIDPKYVDDLQKIFNHKRPCLELPKELICPLSGILFKNPVLTPEGKTYEKDAILQKISSGESRYRIADLVPNLTLKQYIDEFIEE